MENAQAYISCVLREHGSRWVARMGWDAAYSEALFGAMKGLISWLLLDGPYNSAIPTIQTFILKGIMYHFGRAVPWYVGPVRINVRRYAADPEAGLRQVAQPDEDMSVEDLSEFSEEDDGFRAVEEEDAYRTLGTEILLTASSLDQSGAARQIVDLRHGITSGSPLTFKEIGRLLGIRKQAAHQRYQKAVRSIRALLGGSPLTPGPKMGNE